ncbi:MAG TPA: NAD(P)/FAD-dependent oxidoreductase [Nitrospirales bacterium]|nr:NAD(P)/FAD-dependent oxidoreductase [Nitrospirales bacterium]
MTRAAVVIGGGFAGLAAAYELAKSGVRVQVLEQDAEVGGLAGSFDVGGQRLEKFYHHWFTSDHHVMDLVRELGETDRVVLRPTRTGMYHAHQFYRLSSPLDVLRFTPLSFPDRIRLGVMVLRAKRVSNWQEIESLTAAEWLRQIGGDNVYRVVWQPLLRGKFGAYADQISAVWFWNKLKLRGGSRGKGQAEVLAYYRGGFAALAARLAQAIRDAGGTVTTSVAVEGFETRHQRVVGVRTTAGLISADAVIATPALPIVADWIQPHFNSGYPETLRRIEYLANVCLVLQLDRSLSDTYWLNVNDPDFPYVGVIEHTNFEPPASYAGRHIVYLSKYCPEDAPLYRMGDREAFDFSVPHIQRMFPHFRREWVQAYHVWRARYAQPIVVRRYSSLIPDSRTPIQGLHLCTMAQVYPEDRGTNYAIREGRKIGRDVAAQLGAVA